MIRFSLDVQNLLAAGVTAFALAVGWQLGCWVTNKLLSLLK